MERGCGSMPKATLSSNFISSGGQFFTRTLSIRCPKQYELFYDWRAHEVFMASEDFKNEKAEILIPYKAPLDLFEKEKKHEGA
jgi:hypothetical protein